MRTPNPFDRDNALAVAGLTAMLVVMALVVVTLFILWWLGWR